MTVSIAITGKSGSGKTTITKAFLEVLKKKRIKRRKGFPFLLDFLHYIPEMTSAVMFSSRAISI